MIESDRMAQQEEKGKETHSDKTSYSFKNFIQIFRLQAQHGNQQNQPMIIFVNSAITKSNLPFDIYSRIDIYTCNINLLWFWSNIFFCLGHLNIFSHTRNKDK